MSILHQLLPLTRMLESVELFGKGGYALWRSKTTSKEEVRSYKLRGIKHDVYLRTCTSDYATFRQIFIEKQYEYPVNFEPKVIIDCGANVGLTSIFYANKYPNAKIISIEPETSNFEILKLNAKNYTNITCLHNGIWDKKAFLEIVDSGEGKWSFTVKEVPHETKNSISAISISDIMEQFQLKTLDIVKVDIEGSEKVVFSKNHEKWLDVTKLVIIELHDRLAKNATKTFFNAIDKYDYKMELIGENIFCTLTEQ